MPIYLQHGNLIDYVPPTDTSTEDVVFMGGLVGIPQTFIPAGELGALSVDGVYMFTKKDGVSVNLGEVVKYCGTTKLAQDSNADLTLGVAVADAEADSLGVKVKINSVLPTDGGGGGGGSGGEVALCGASGLYFDGGNIAIKYCGNSAINADTNGVYLAVCGDSGLSIQNGELVASGGGGGLENLATGTGSLSILGEATTSVGSISVGYGANASSEYAIAIGPDAEVDANNNPDAIAIGHCSLSNNARAIAVGLKAKALGIDSIALGHETYASLGGNSSIAIGAGAQVNGGGSSAIGHYTTTAAIFAANFGYNTKLYDPHVASIGSYSNALRTQLYVIAEGSPLSNQYLNGKAGLAYAVWGDSEIYTNGKVKEGKIIAFETLFANGVDFVPTTEEPDMCCC